MISYQRKGSHTVSRLSCHIVWSTKYRYNVLKGDIKERCRELLIQICDAEGLEILKGVLVQIIFIFTLNMLQNIVTIFS